LRKSNMNPNFICCSFSGGDGTDPLAYAEVLREVDRLHVHVISTSLHDLKKACRTAELLGVPGKITAMHDNHRVHQRVGHECIQAIRILGERLFIYRAHSA
jgi:hypothetical protein